MRVIRLYSLASTDIQLLVPLHAFQWAVIRCRAQGDYIWSHEDFVLEGNSCSAPNQRPESCAPLLPGHDYNLCIITEYIGTARHELRGPELRVLVRLGLHHCSERWKHSYGHGAVCVRFGRGFAAWAHGEGTERVSPAFLGVVIIIALFCVGWYRPTPCAPVRGRWCFFLCRSFIYFSQASSRWRPFGNR